MITKEVNEKIIRCYVCDRVLDFTSKTVSVTLRGQNYKATTVPVVRLPVDSRGRELYRHSSDTCSPDAGQEKGRWGRNRYIQTKVQEIKEGKNINITRRKIDIRRKVSCG